LGVEQRAELSFWGSKETLNYVIYLNLSGTEWSPLNGPLIKTNTAAPMPSI